MLVEDYVKLNNTAMAYRKKTVFSPTHVYTGPFYKRRYQYIVIMLR